MRRLSCVSLCTGLFLLLPLTNMSAGDKLEPGFKLLFNGKNLDGWKEVGGKKESLDGKTEAYMGRIKVMDGKLVYVYDKKDKVLGANRYFETAKEFGGDVHFKFDFKPGPACNNDILFRGTKFDIVLNLKSVKEGEWSTFELIATGDKIEHKINGASARMTTVKNSAATPFKLRAEFGVIEIKNIRVKE